MSAFVAEVKSWQSTGGIPLVNGKIYIGTVLLDPVANPKAIFSDRDLTVPLANPVLLDAYGNPTSKIWVEGRYSMKVVDSADVQVFLELDNGEEPGIANTPLTNVQGFDAITADAVPTISALIDKAQFYFTVAVVNSGPVTLQIDATPVKNVKRNLDQDIVKGQFQAGQIVKVVYNETADVYEWTNQNIKVDYRIQGANITPVAAVDLSVATGNNLSIIGAGPPIETLGTVVAGANYKLLFPGDTPVTITSSSIANPSSILTAAVHGKTSGDIVLIEGHSGAIPDINGSHVITVTSTTTFTIPVNVTTGGTGGTITGIPSMEHDATKILLPGDKTHTFAPGDTLEVISLGANVWRGFNYQPVAGNTPTGAKMGYEGLLAPHGWILDDGGTIGNAVSGATTRANDDTEKLFTLYWNSMADAQRPVSTGRGASAAADFAANKTLTLGGMGGKMLVGTGGTAPAIHGDTGGAETVALSTAELAAHEHQQQYRTGGAGGTANISTFNAASTVLNNTDDDTSTTGSGTAHENMPPWESANWIIKL